MFPFQLNTIKRLLRFGQNLAIDKPKALSSACTNKFLRFFPLFSKNFITYSGFGHSIGIFKTFNLGKLTYCNFLKSSKFEPKVKSIISCKFKNKLISENKNGES